MTNARIEMRIARLERRVARLERSLALLDRWDEGKHRPLRAFLAEILDDDPDATDDEIVEALAEKADELARFQGIRELIADLGIRLAARIALWAHQNRRRLLAQRAERLRERINELRRKPDDARDDDPVSFGGTDSSEDPEAMLAELGMSPEMIEHTRPAKR
jgi:hypothetical protein